MLGRDDIVVADGLNYIKGFRYQLFCEAKALGTPSCVVSFLPAAWSDWTLKIPEVHIGTPITTCREMNNRLLANPETDGGYPDDVFENLVFRYEEPNGMTRWDSPLFTVLFSDDVPPLEAIWEAMIGKEGEAKVVKPNAATVLVSSTWL
jgi:protein KTI12